MSNTTWFAANNMPRGKHVEKITTYSYTGGVTTINLSAGTYKIEL